MYCSNCGFKKDGGNFCSKCGNKLIINGLISEEKIDYTDQYNSLNKEVILKSKKPTKINVQEKKKTQFFDFRLSTILGFPSGIIAWVWLQESGYGWVSTCLLIIVLFYAFWPAKKIK